MTYKFINSVVTFKTEDTDFKFLSKANQSKSAFTNFITWDIETRTINGKMTPYCICIFDGGNRNSFYLSDFNTVDEMLLAAIKLIFTESKGTYRYDGYIVYAHNFSKFDSIFLLKLLSIYSDRNKYTLDLIKRDSDIIEVTVSKPKSFKIRFRDSLLLLKGSLKALGKSYTNDKKGIFPYLFVNNSVNPLDYVGDIPAFKYFSNITINEYKLYCKGYRGKVFRLTPANTDLVIVIPFVSVY